MVLAIGSADRRAARGEVNVANVFGDHMVLPREMPVPMWGRAEPGETVTVEFAGKKKTVTAAPEGAWSVTLDALAASAEPRSLTVSGSKTSKAIVSSALTDSEIARLAGGAPLSSVKADWLVNLNASGAPSRNIGWKDVPIPSTERRYIACTCTGGYRGTFRAYLNGKLVNELGFFSLDIIGGHPMYLGAAWHTHARGDECLLRLGRAASSLRQHALGGGNLFRCKEIKSTRHRTMKLTALALVAIASRLCAQTVLVQPYIQPGDGPDSIIVIWLTDQTPGNFTVEYGAKNLPPRPAKPERVALDFGIAKGKAAAPAQDEPDAKGVVIPEREQHYFKYSATLAGLPADSVIDYQVKLAGEVVRQGSAPTRATATKPIRFVMVGDLANGKEQQNAVAFEISRVQPQFLVVLGDIVYPTGRVSQYMHHFWGTYNQPQTASAATGAPLMASVPFYAALGNHDVDTHKLADLPDALGAYYFFHAPLNGPGEGTWNTPIGKCPEAVAFRAAVGASFPALGAYSFENGPAHFLVLDNSGYANLESPKVRDWIERDLRGSKARWKFVCYHAPMFHSSHEHYTEQKMRMLAPLLESCGVDIAFAGHVHNYQRSLPLRFTPSSSKRLPGGYVNGEFKLDTKFDGTTHTQPDGVIHIVSGGGGGTLYKGDLKKTSEYFQTLPPGNWVPYTAKFVADRHSFTVVDLMADRLQLRALDASGKEIDRIEITKPPSPILK
ncbi:MAG: acid phosphatase type 7 [Chthoniobacter sp.]|nr:acid phosphatase type 7 [Chthoniobacter sp.]